ncbi:MAG: pilus assembly protein TadG-related protein [bacterium]|nr:pilus assembly protein TadG-related protein [bacterium]
MHDPECGSTMVITAFWGLGLTLVLGLVADVGAVTLERTRLQSACDAAALAGARGLMQGPDQARKAVRDLARQNGFLPADGDITITQGSRVTVRLRTPVASWVGKLSRLLPSERERPGQLAIGARSIADLHCVDVTQGLRPLGLPGQRHARGEEILLKRSGPGNIRGNFQALAIDGPGARTYRSSLLDGARRTLRKGEMIPTEPGDMAGPTAATLQQLIGRDTTSFLEAELGTRTPRVITVALLDRDFFEASGRSNVTIAGFARVYLSYTTRRGEVVGRYLETLDQDQVAGTALRYAVRLADETVPAPVAAVR